MNDKQSFSWIFLSLAIASNNQPASFTEISQIADGINHSVPTQKEIQASLKWLATKDLIAKTGKKYHLTTKGIQFYKEHSVLSNHLLKVWELIEQSLCFSNL